MRTSARTNQELPYGYHCALRRNLPTGHGGSGRYWTIKFHGVACCCFLILLPPVCCLIAWLCRCSLLVSIFKGCGGSKWTTTMAEGTMTGCSLSQSLFLSLSFLLSVSPSLLHPSYFLHSVCPFLFSLFFSLPALFILSHCLSSLVVARPRRKTLPSWKV